MSIKKSISTKKSINVWSYKPWWCQPWSILLTGCGVVGGSWWLFHRIWLTGFISDRVALRKCRDCLNRDHLVSNSLNSRKKLGSS